jgi:Tat protein translocase TatB subunit
MFDIGLQEMLVIGVLALLVFGPSKLPELGRMVGRALREFRRASDEFRSTVETNLHINDLDPIPEPAPGPAVVAAPDSVADPGSSAAAAVADATSAGADAGEPERVEIAEPYCAQRGSRLFHRRECAWVARIPEVERVYLKRVSDARDQGFRTCPVCEPWEPA